MARQSRAGTVIDELRRFACGAKGAGPRVPASLARSAERALSLVGHSLRQARIVVVGDPGTTSPWVQGQALPNEQVLVQLVLEAEPPPGAARTTEDGAVALRRADTGGGIGTGLMPRHFALFVRTKARTSARDWVCRYAKG